MNFDFMTINDLRELTEQFDRLRSENFLLKKKYPTKLSKVNENPTAEELLEEKVEGKNVGIPSEEEFDYTHN